MVEVVEVAENTANDAQNIPKPILGENIRTYTFPVPGYIPGIPGMFSGGSRVTVNEDTMQVMLIEAGQPLPDESQPVEQIQPAPQEQLGQGEALPEQQSTLADALKQLGG